jgi:hypothetical protein
VLHFLAHHKEIDKPSVQMPKEHLNRIPSRRISTRMKKRVIKPMQIGPIIVPANAWGPNQNGQSVQRIVPCVHPLKMGKEGRKTQS